MHILRWTFIAGITFALFACTGSQITPRPAATQIDKPQAIIAAAHSALGAPYLYGGNTPTGFDCSGLVSYAYRQVGIIVPRSSSEQFRQATSVPLQNLHPGDILFFRLNPPKVSHVAIYASNGRFIHSPSSGKFVSYASLDNPYWNKHLVAAGRFNQQ